MDVSTILRYPLKSLILKQIGQSLILSKSIAWKQVRLPNPIFSDYFDQSVLFFFVVAQTHLGFYNFVMAQTHNNLIGGLFGRLAKVVKCDLR